MEAILCSYLLLSGLIVTVLVCQKQLEKSSDSSPDYKRRWEADEQEIARIKEPTNESKVTFFVSGIFLLSSGFILAYVVSELSVNQPASEFSGRIFHSPEDAFFYALALVLGGVGTRGWGTQGSSMLMYTVIAFQICWFLYTAGYSEDVSVIFATSALVIFFAILARFRLFHEKKKSGTQDL